MSDLAQMLALFEREEYAASVGAQLAETGRHAVRVKVVRARRIRAAATIAVAAVAVVACATGAWALTQPDRNDPAVPEPSPTVTTPSPSPSPTPSASVTPEPVHTMPDFTGGVTVDPQLPSAEAITPEAWNEAGPGWVLATYREEVYGWDDATNSQTYSHGPQAVYLISPDGTRYELTSISGDEPVYVVEWDPGARVALALAGGPNVDSGLRWVSLYLLTGDTRPISEADVAGSSWTRPSDSDIQGTIGVYASGPPEEIPGFDPLLALPEQPAPSVTGDTEAAIATAQSLVPDGEECTDALSLRTTVVVACGREYMFDGSSEGGGWFDHYFVYVADSGRGEGAVVDVRIPTEYGNDTLQLLSGWFDPSAGFVGDTVIAMAIGEGMDPCQEGRYSVTTAGAVPLPGVEALKAEALKADKGYANIFYNAGIVDSSVYTVVTGGCSGEAMPWALVRDDIATGASAVLIPFPQTFQETGSGWVTGSIESAYVVPSRP